MIEIQIADTVKDQLPIVMKLIPTIIALGTVFYKEAKSYHVYSVPKKSMLPADAIFLYEFQPGDPIDNYTSTDKFGIKFQMVYDPNGQSRSDGVPYSWKKVE